MKLYVYYNCSMGIDSHNKNIQKHVHIDAVDLERSHVPSLTRLRVFSGPSHATMLSPERRSAPWSQVASVAKATRVATGIPEEVAEGKAQSGTRCAQYGTWKGGQSWVARLSLSELIHSFCYGCSLLSLAARGISSRGPLFEFHHLESFRII